MSKIAAVKVRFLEKGVQESNVDYAIEAVKDGTKREYILDNLTADYRGMSREMAFALVEALFVANGGEFRKENRSGFLFGGAAMAAGLFLTVWVVSAFAHDPVHALVLWRVAIPMVLLLTVGGRLLWKAARGKYRDTDEPWKA